VKVWQSLLELLFCVDAVRRNPVTRHARDSEIEDIEVVVKDWLRMASRRAEAKKAVRENVVPVLCDSGSNFDVEVY